MVLWASALLIPFIFPSTERATHRISRRQRLRYIRHVRRRTRRGPSDMLLHLYFQLTLGRHARETKHTWLLKHRSVDPRGIACIYNCQGRRSLPVRAFPVTTQWPSGGCRNQRRRLSVPPLCQQLSSLDIFQLSCIRVQGGTQLPLDSLLYCAIMRPQCCILLPHTTPRHLTTPQTTRPPSSANFILRTPPP